MTTVSAAHRRVLRRETHASRTGPAVFTGIILLLVSLTVVAASVAFAVGSGLPAEVWEWFVNGGLAGDSAAISTVLAAAIILAILGVLAIAAALMPGRLARHGTAGEDLVFLIDDAALATAAADNVASRLGLSSTQVVAELSRRHLRVRITPTSGVSFSEASAREAASNAIAALGLNVQVTVTTSREGVLS